ncbi:MAG: hypothetical protein IJQ31_07735 [Thermoguttaceae bacterium]|nr:hypothetical protein [Thermoguttaceae bacterium]
MKQIPTPTTTVSFYELAGSPVEAFTSEGFEAKRRFLVRWEEREAFARDVMGHSSTFNYQSSTYYPNRTSVFPVKITFRPADENSIQKQEIAALHLGLNSYSGWALAEIEYATLTDEDLDLGVQTESGTSLTYRLSWESIDVELPSASGWVWTDSGAAIPEDLSVVQRIPQAVHTIIWSRVLNPPWTAIQQMQGKVNSVEFLDCPAGTLLFEGAAANKLYRSTFQQGESPFCWAITFTFRQKAVHHDSQTYGWNHFFRTSDGSWAMVQSNQKKIYDEADFKTLFES